jgi:hypothetical protein
MNSFLQSETDIFAVKTGAHLPPDVTRAYLFRNSFSGYNADFRPLPLVASMCPCACTGAGCGEHQVA